MAPSCPETVNIELMRDGRLPEVEASLLVEHARACPACGREARRLEALRAGLASLPLDEPSTADVARQREALLFAAGSEPARRPAARRVAALAVTLALAASAALMLGTGAVQRARDALSGVERSHEPAVAVTGPAAPAKRSPNRAVSAPGPTPLAALSVEVDPSRGADWSRSATAGGETLVLRAGQLRVAVRHRAADGRVVVRLPDGELVDVGTVFVVRVNDGRTDRVSVEEGRVSLRLSGLDAIELGAGESWDRGGHASASPGPRAPGVLPEPGAPCAQADAFDVGLVAFTQGRYATAASELGRFQSACAHDRRGEDAAYLTMVALARAGRTEQAVRAARSYLARFPSGFRKQEAEKLAAQVTHDKK